MSLTASLGLELALLFEQVLAGALTLKLLRLAGLAAGEPAERGPGLLLRRGVRVVVGAAWTALVRGGFIRIKRAVPGVAAPVKHLTRATCPAHVDVVAHRVG